MWNFENCKPKYVVMRRAVLMEDEGREQMIHGYDTQKEAEDWIAEQKGEYFGPQDYYVAKCSITVA